MRSWTLISVASLVIGSSLGCGSAVSATGTDGEDESSTGSTTDPTGPTTPTTTTDPQPPGTSTTGPAPTSSSTSLDPDSSSGGSTSTGVPPIVCDENGCAIDILVVVDNSARMAGAQTELARSMVALEEYLRGLDADVHVMFTTTDSGNPLCTPFEPKGYEPARGAPISDACTDRLQDFTSLTGTSMVPEACTQVCPQAVAPIGDPFVAFGPQSNNLPEQLPPRDVDGDGQDDPPAAQAMACLAPMGINGCGYESQLESMLQALNPSAAWNMGANPFMRDEAALGIIILSDEADCSVAEFDIMEDPEYQELNPDSMQPESSSAICWNAGVSCEGPDAMGVYANCEPVGSNLHPVSRYDGYLVDVLRDRLGKPVAMAGILGMPAVTANSPEPPFLPTEGGYPDLVIRNWQEDDILPDEAAAGVTPADKQFNLGIGPACTAAESTTSRQATPIVRMASVCESLNVGDDPLDTRCCLESVCGENYDAAMWCLGSTLGSALTAR